MDIEEFLRRVKGEPEKPKKERISAFSHAPYHIWVIGKGDKVLVTQKEDDAPDIPYGFYFYYPNNLEIGDDIKEEVKIEKCDSESGLWLIRDDQDYYLFNHKPTKDEEGRITVEEEIENPELDLPLFVMPGEISLEDGEACYVILKKL